MRRTTLVLAAAVAALGTAACDPDATTSSNSTGPTVTVTTGTAPAAPVTSAGDAEAAKDVEVTGCVVDPAIHWPTANLKVTNHSSRTSNYIIQVEFVDKSGTRVGEAPAATNNLAAGGSATLKALGATEVKGEITCRVSGVNRFAAP
ncbi:FxLYD domain-containing protein [Kitasatospora sp. NPDC101157]|uniref:FxLYD domain-containing protein n=1 Tax=Kitasatospora sp. NPDC101157 TaxID=3364098 RepID=UPI0038291BEF